MEKLIGKKPNQVPTNADLGSMAYQDSSFVNIGGGKVNLSTGAAIASAATVDLNTVSGGRAHITGTTTITAFTLSKGPVTVFFDGVLTLTHHTTTNNLPGAANITTAAGDRAVYESDGTTVYCSSYTKANGQSVISPPLFRVVRTSNTVLSLGDKGKLFEATTGSWTQTVAACATLTPGWWSFFHNSGPGVITIDADAAETVNGAPTVAVQSGEFGVLQTDGSSLTFTVIRTSHGTGSTSTAGALTLTNLSTAMHVVTPSTNGQSVTLPDGTTCLKIAAMFKVYNAGKFAMPVKNSVGTLLGFLLPKERMVVGLNDNTTAAGVWDIEGASLVAVDLFASVTIASPSLVGYLDMGDGRHIFLVRSVGVGTYIFSYSDVTDTAGTPVLLTGWDGIHNGMIKTSANAVMVVYNNYSTADCGIVVVTLSSNVCTVNTAVTWSAPHTTYGKFSISAVGTSWIVAAVGQFSAQVFAITLSGTTITKGTDVTLTGIGAGFSPVQVVAFTSALFLVVAKNSGTSGLYWYGFSVAGTTISSGSLGTVGNSANYVCRRFDSGRVGLVWIDPNLKCAVINMTTINPTVNTGSLGAITIASAAKIITKRVANQLIVATAGTSSTDNTVNVLTDNAGSATVGTAISGKVVGENGYMFMGEDASSMYLGCAYQSVETELTVEKITISSNNPVVTRIGSAKAAGRNSAVPGKAVQFTDEVRPSHVLSGPSLVGTFTGNEPISLGIQGDVLVEVRSPIIGTSQGLGTFETTVADRGWVYTAASGRLDISRVRVA